MKYICAVCVRNDAYALHEIDGRDRPICRECACEPVPDPGFRAIRKLHGDMVGSPAEIILAAVRNNPGATFIELRESLNMPGDPGRGVRSIEARTANTYGVALKRLCTSGRVIRDGVHPHFTYRVSEVMKRRAA